MKKTILFLAMLFVSATQAQELRQMPMVTVNGEGKVKVVPDQASITLSLETTGAKAAEVKKENDTKIDAVLKYIKSVNIAKEDYQTQRVYLNDSYDYEKKKHNYVATQTISILIRDLTKYDALIEGLVDKGINNISNIQFRSSQAEAYKADARGLAMRDAQKKARELTMAIGQKMGAAYTITDNTAIEYPRPMYEMKAMNMVAGAFGGNDTLAAGEIEITANVTVSFRLVD